MAAALTLDSTPVPAAPPAGAAPRVTLARAVAALLWAAAVMVAVGDSSTASHADVRFAAAALLASYPLIDVVASLLVAQASPAASRALRLNAAISGVAVVAIAVAAFASDAGATLGVFGIWAAVSGAFQFGLAVNRRRSEGGQIAMLISGGLSTIAGLSFLASSLSDTANLKALGGYMAVGAVLYVVSALRAGRRGQAS